MMAGALRLHSEGKPQLQRQGNGSDHLDLCVALLNCLENKLNSVFHLKCVVTCFFDVLSFIKTWLLCFTF